MDFFMGFLTSSILSAIFFCVYVFLKEEIRKNRFRNIIPGQTYYVQSIGKVTVQSIDHLTVSYVDTDDTLYRAPCEAFLAFSKLSLKETGPIRTVDYQAEDTSKTKRKYYNKKGQIFDVYVD